MDKIYNFLAELCSLIISSCTDDTLFVNYSCISPIYKKQIRKDIYRNVSILSVRYLKKEDLTRDFFAKLCTYVKHLSEKSDYFSLIELAQVLDEALEELLQEKIREYQADDFSVTLNTNREITGVGLLPRCSCVWERKHRLSHSYNRLDSFMFNLLLMENSVLGELIDKHIFLKNDYFPNFEASGQIKIGATPLRAEKHHIVRHYEKAGVQYCDICCSKENYAEDNELIWQKILTLAKEHCDITVFPELLGNPETEGFIISKLKALCEADRKTMPSLIILPSVYEKRKNTVTVLNRAGDIICRQSKQNPYRQKYQGSGYLEDIITNRVVNILHYEGIGRIAILICRDFLTTNYMEQLMRCFKLTLIIVPSFSTGSYDFRQSFDLCAHDDCNVVWINTCAAFEEGKQSNFKNIGYVRKRIGRNDDDSQKLCEMPACKEFFSGNCKHNCFFTETIQGV